MRKRAHQRRRNINAMVVPAGNGGGDDRHRRSFQATDGAGIHDERGKIIIALEDGVNSAMQRFSFGGHRLFQSDQKQRNARQPAF